MEFILLDGELKLIMEILMQSLQVCSHLVSTLPWNWFKGDFKFWVEPFVGKKWCDTHGQMLCVVVYELHKE